MNRFLRIERGIQIETPRILRPHDVISQLHPHSTNSDAKIRPFGASHFAEYAEHSVSTHLPVYRACKQRYYIPLRRRVVHSGARVTLLLDVNNSGAGNEAGRSAFSSPLCPFTINSRSGSLR